MKAFVAIASTNNRFNITEKNRWLLQAQGVCVLVNYANESKTLGEKWQHTIELIRPYDPTHLIITGSDDILSKDFVEKYCTKELFTGLKQWYIWHKEGLHLLEYLPKQCLGGGRVYSRELLDKMNWQVFDTSRNKLLDDKGFNFIVENKIAPSIHYTPDILAVKGDWETMNPVNLKHRNVRLLKTYKGDEAIKIMKERFGYE